MTMNLIFTEGFGAGNYAAPTPKWNGAVFAGTGTGRFGGTAWYLQQSSQAPETYISPISTMMHMGMAIKKVALGANGHIFSFYEEPGGQRHVGVNLNADGNLAVTRATTVLETGATPLQANVWAHIEMRFYIANTGGRVTLKLNGSQIIDFTGDTRNAGTSGTVSTFYLQNLSNTSQVWYDDLYIYTITDYDNDPWIGDARIFTLFPNATGTYSQWTPSTGTVNYQNVDEAISDGDSSYNYSSSTGTIDSFNFSDISGSGTVIAVNHYMMSRKDDAGTRTLNYVTQRGTLSLGTQFNINDGYAISNRIMETDPIISGSWTIPNVNASEFGYKMVA